MQIAVNKNIENKHSAGKTIGLVAKLANTPPLETVKVKSIYEIDKSSAIRKQYQKNHGEELQINEIVLPGRPKKKSKAQLFREQNFTLDGLWRTFLGHSGMEGELI